MRAQIGGDLIAGRKAPKALGVHFQAGVSAKAAELQGFVPGTADPTLPGSKKIASPVVDQLKLDTDDDRMQESILLGLW